MATATLMPFLTQACAHFELGSQALDIFSNKAADESTMNVKHHLNPAIHVNSKVSEIVTSDAEFSSFFANISYHSIVQLLISDNNFYQVSKNTNTCGHGISPLWLIVLCCSDHVVNYERVVSLATTKTTVLKHVLLAFLPQCNFGGIIKYSRNK